MSLTTPFRVQKLQTALHAKAKESPDFRFYALYDKVYRKDVLAFAYERCKANGGAAGVDGQTFEDIEAYGRERWLDELAQELKSRTYQPLPVRRVYIPKPDGKQRPLGVPAIRDRAAEMAAVLVLEPIFESDLQPEQYAYRRDRSALDAVQHVHKKTRVCKLPEEKFDFLGYTFGCCYSMRRGRVYLGSTPSKKRVQRICRAISDETGCDKVWQDSKTVVDRLNRMMIGWANYFCLGPVSKAYSAVDLHARRRLRRWLCDKHKEPRPAYKRFPEASLNSVYGLVQLPHRTVNLPWAKA
jgi:hypothetical protein